MVSRFREVGGGRRSSSGGPDRPHHAVGRGGRGTGRHQEYHLTRLTLRVRIGTGTKRPAIGAIAHHPPPPCSRNRESPGQGEAVAVSSGKSRSGLALRRGRTMGQYGQARALRDTSPDAHPAGFSGNGGRTGGRGPATAMPNLRRRSRSVPLRPDSVADIRGWLSLECQHPGTTVPTFEAPEMTESQRAKRGPTTP